MESLIRIEVVYFHEDKFACPVIQGEPYVVVNSIIDSIGLNYKTTLDTIKNSRFDRWIAYLQMKKVKKAQNQSALRQISFEKNGEKLEFSALNSSQWEDIFSQVKGYKYVSLPIRKVAAWLYSISASRVKPEVRPILEMYQDECDEVLFQHFFGSVAQRKSVLIEKTELSLKIAAAEERLKQNADYQNYINLKAEEMRMGKTLRKIDQSIVTNQKSLWDQDFISQTDKHEEKGESS